MRLPSSFLSGFRMVDGQDLLNLFNALLSAVVGRTAGAGGGQANAVPITSEFTEFATVTSGNDSAVLPPATLDMIGQSFTIMNSSGNSLQVFGTGTDTITPNNSITPTASGTGVALATTKIGTYWCFAVGKWKLFLTA